MFFKENRSLFISRLKLVALGSLVITGLSLLPKNLLPVIALPRTATSAVRNSPKEVIDQVWQIVYRDYLDSSGKYDSKEWINLRRELLSKNYVDAAHSYEAIRGMLSSLGDPYTRFLEPKEFKEMRIDTSGELTGVGIQLSLDKKTNQVVVISPIEGTPAFRAGIKQKDVIVSIDGQSTSGMTIENVVKLIRGKRGTKVTLGLTRQGILIEVPLIRDRIAINAVDSQLNKTSGGLKVGYIRLKQFNANSSKEMKLAINKLEEDNALGYVLDLRSNPGGLLEASIDIARQWLNEGTIVSTLTRNGIKDVRKANGRALTIKPVVVLVNEGSASASEILSGAIQDNKRGTLVGVKTFGKGLVQSVRGLSDGSGLTVTVAKYLTPNGTDIHKNGIKPDIEAKISDQQALVLTREDIGTYKDIQYKIAETELVNSLSLSQSFNPKTTNLSNALKARLSSPLRI